MATGLDFLFLEEDIRWVVSGLAYFPYITVEVMTSTVPMRNKGPAPSEKKITFGVGFCNIIKTIRR